MACTSLPPNCTAGTRSSTYSVPWTMVPVGPALLGVMVTLIVAVWPGLILSRLNGLAATERSQKSPTSEVTEPSKSFAVAVIVMLFTVPGTGGAVKPSAAARAGRATQPPAVTGPVPAVTVTVAVTDGAPENTSGSPRNGLMSKVIGTVELDVMVTWLVWVGTIHSAGAFPGGSGTGAGPKSDSE